MKLNLSSFKKVKSDKTHTTLKHKDGHEFKLAHNSLSKSNKKELSSIPMADGGEVSDDEIISKKERVDKYNNEHEDEQKEYPQDVIVKMQKTDITHKQKLADGGDVEEKPIKTDSQGNVTLKGVGPASGQRVKMDTKSEPSTHYASAPDEVEAEPKKQSPREQAAQSIKRSFGEYAEGGHVCQMCGGGMYANGGSSDKKPKDDETINDAIGNPFGSGVEKANGGMIPHDRPVHSVKRSSMGEIKRKQLAEGGEADLPPVPAAAQQDNSQDIPQDSPSEIALPVNISGVTPDQAPPQAQPEAVAAGPQTQDQAIASMPNPTAQSAYQTGIKGLQQQMSADSGLAQAQADIAKGNMTAQAKMMSDYDTANKKLQATRQSVTHWLSDPANAVDANRYMGDKSTGNRIGTAIGLLLGGLGAGFSGHNDALSYINKQIDNDIDAQKANIGKHQNLLSAIDHEYNDLNTSTAVLRSIMTDQTIAKMQQAGAQAKTPQAQAAMTQSIAALQQQMAPMIQQASMRQMLAGQNAAQAGKPGSLNQQDPAQFVPAVVPADRQKDVFNEIQAAQDTRRMGASIKDAFEQAAKENTVMKTGAGLLRTPASVYALHQAMQPTFKDLEGTVRQAAMDNTFKNITPQPGDSDHTIQQKRQALNGYLKSKASAPQAKAFGIDLDKFASTTSGPAETRTYQGKQYQKVPGGWKIIQ